jgi:hypothetical protein
MPKRAEMPGSIVGYAVSLRLRRVNFAVIANPADKTETEAFQASEGHECFTDSGNLKSPVPSETPMKTLSDGVPDHIAVYF